MIMLGQYASYIPDPFFKSCFAHYCLTRSKWNLILNTNKIRGIILKYGTAMIAIVRHLATAAFLEMIRHPDHKLISRDRIPRLILIMRKNALFCSNRLGDFYTFTSSLWCCQLACQTVWKRTSLQILGLLEFYRNNWWPFCDQLSSLITSILLFHKLLGFLHINIQLVVPMQYLFLRCQ